MGAQPQRALPPSSGWQPGAQAPPARPGAPPPGPPGARPGYGGPPAASTARRRAAAGAPQGGPPPPRGNAGASWSTTSGRATGAASAVRRRDAQLRRRRRGRAAAGPPGPAPTTGAAAQDGRSAELRGVAEGGVVIGHKNTILHSGRQIMPRRRTSAARWPRRAARRAAPAGGGSSSLSSGHPRTQLVWGRRRRARLPGGALRVSFMIHREEPPQVALVPRRRRVDGEGRRLYVHVRWRQLAALGRVLGGLGALARGLLLPASRFQRELLRRHVFVHFALLGVLRHEHALAASPWLLLDGLFERGALAPRPPAWPFAFVSWPFARFKLMQCVLNVCFAAAGRRA